jgi:hypothetical protein
MSFLWTEDVEYKMITMWQESPFLFDTSMQEYHDKILKHDRLKEIAKEIGCTGNYKSPQHTP